MESIENRRRKLLYDLPVASDAFSGGGHKRTASSLANTIQEFDDQTRSIGLEGKWGSGKSTIVEIAKSILDTEKKAVSTTYSLSISGLIRIAILDAHSWKASYRG